MKQAIVAVIGALALVLGLGSDAVSSSLSEDSDTSQTNLYTHTCSIVFDSKDSFGRTKPRIDTALSRGCVGVRSVSAPTANGALNVNLDDTSRQIVGVVVSTGATLLDKGIACGPSNGLSKGTVYVDCYLNGNRIKAHGPEIYGSANRLTLLVETFAG